MPGPGSLEVRRELDRLARLFALVSLGFTVTLALAPFQDRVSEWREVQARYNRAARAAGQAPLAVRLRQVWKPALDRVDRCTSCHVGMEEGVAALTGEPLFAGHGPMPHRPDQFGCVPCHRGQGRATRREDAHGLSESWLDPMLPAKFLEAGCGSCHAGIVAPRADAEEDGAAAFESLGCRSCHRLGGSGDPRHGDLTWAGLRLDRDWLERHVEGLAREGSLAGPPPDADTLAHLGDYLSAQIGAPTLVRGKRLFDRKGCRGCHRVGNLGGRFGPELTEVGNKTVYDLDFSNLPGERATWIWHLSHFQDPRAVVPTSEMPEPGLEAAEREALATFVLSLRNLRLPIEATPPDVLRLRATGRRDFPDDGEGLFVALCSGCHGEAGEGREWQVRGVVTPMLAVKGFVLGNSRRFVRAAILEGRADRGMPAWKAGEGGLTTREVERIIDWLEEARPRVPPLAQILARPGDATRGATLYAERCVACHGPEGEGGAFGQSLRDPGFRARAGASYLYGILTEGWPDAGMPSYAFLPAADLADLLALLRTWGPAPETLDERPPSGQVKRGREIFAEACRDCHGEDGMGGWAPMINAPPFLRQASNGFLRHAIVDHGRVARSGPQARLPKTLLPDEVEHLLACIRNWSGEERFTLQTAPERPDAIARGAALFAARCPTCHGPEGEGKTAAGLTQPEVQLNVTDAHLTMTILAGRPGTPMQAWMSASENRLSAADALDVTAYLRHLGRKRVEREGRSDESSGQPHAPIGKGGPQ